MSHWGTVRISQKELHLARQQTSQSMGVFRKRTEFRPPNNVIGQGILIVNVIGQLQRSSEKLSIVSAMTDCINKSQLN